MTTCEIKDILKMRMAIHAARVDAGAWKDIIQLDLLSIVLERL